METLNRVIEGVFGTTDIVGVLLGFYFICIGIAARLGYAYLDRKDKTKSFDFFYWSKDNVVRLFLNCLFAYIGMRFGKILFETDNILLLGFFIGLGGDLLAKSIISKMKNRFSIEEQITQNQENESNNGQDSNDL